MHLRGLEMQTGREEGERLLSVNTYKRWICGFARNFFLPIKPDQFCTCRNKGSYETGAGSLLNLLLTVLDFYQLFFILETATPFLTLDNNVTTHLLSGCLEIRKSRRVLLAGWLAWQNFWWWRRNRLCPRGVAHSLLIFILLKIRFREPI